MKPTHTTLRRPAALPRPLLSLILCAAAFAAFAPPAGAQEPRVRTDRDVYAEPTLPTRPAAGGIYRDAVFGTEIMRVTDADDGPAPGLGTFYSMWPTFNADGTRLLIRQGVTGGAIVKQFYPDTFTLAPGRTDLPSNFGDGLGDGPSWQFAAWSRSDPNVIYAVSNGPLARLMSYNLSGGGSWAEVKRFQSQISGGTLFHMTVSEDQDVFAFYETNNVGQNTHFLVWRRSTDTLLYVPTSGPNSVLPTGYTLNEVDVDKTGKYLVIAVNLPPGTSYQQCTNGFAGTVSGKVLNLETGQYDTYHWCNTDDPPGHGGLGRGISVGQAFFDYGLTRRHLSNIHSFTKVFTPTNASGNVDFTEHFHASMLADNEDWITVGTYDDDFDTSLTDYGVFEDEIYQVALDGSQRFRRLAHSRTNWVDGRLPNANELNGYWAIAKPTVSRDSRYIAYTSNWEDSGRTDMFIMLVPNIDESTFFVRQHYRDFFGRAGDSSGVGFWRGEIEQCGADANCRIAKRENTSAAFFLSIEFQETGYLAYRAWGAAFGPQRVNGRWALTRAEFLPDLSLLGQNLAVGMPGWQQQLEANKAAYFDAFVGRAAFAASYPAWLTGDQYVDSLNATAGWPLSQAERDQLVLEVSAGAKTRAQALRVVAEDADFVGAQKNRAFVTMEYFGYLRRDPDTAGFDGWLNKLNTFGGNWQAAEMVKAFITSAEYRSRFGQ